MTNEAKYIVDAVADIYIDWRVSISLIGQAHSLLTVYQAKWVPQLSNKTDEYKNKTAPEYYKLVAQYYADSKGPFLLGDRITYADFAVYQSIDNDEKIGTLPVRLSNDI